jgi:hypothetical protein
MMFHVAIRVGRGCGKNTLIKIKAFENAIDIKSLGNPKLFFVVCHDKCEVKNTFLLSW